MLIKRGRKFSNLMQYDSRETYGDFSSQPCLIGAGNDDDVLRFLGINMDKVVHLGRESSAKMGTMPSSRCLSLCVHGIHSNTLLFFRNNRLSHGSFDHFAPNFRRPHLGHIPWSGMKPSFTMWASRCQSIIINLS